MLGCKPIDTPLDANVKILAKVPVDRNCYQRLVAKLIYVVHTRPDITYAISVVSQYMHDPYASHMDVVTRILRYLKSAPGKGILFSPHQPKKLQVDAYADVLFPPQNPKKFQVEAYADAD